jgi:hypothetical protein
MNLAFVNGATLPTAIIFAVNKKDKSRLKTGDNALAFWEFGSQ